MMMSKPASKELFQAQNDKNQERIDTALSESEIRRTQGESFYARALILLRVVLLGALGVFFIFFLIALFIAGVAPQYLGESEGARALQNLFVQVASNASDLALIFLGFFFRDYLLRLRQTE